MLKKREIDTCMTENDNDTNSSKADKPYPRVKTNDEIQKIINPNNHTTTFNSKPPPPPPPP